MSMPAFGIAEAVPISREPFLFKFLIACGIFSPLGIYVMRRIFTPLLNASSKSSKCKLAPYRMPLHSITPSMLVWVSLRFLVNSRVSAFGPDVRLY